MLVACEECHRQYDVGAMSPGDNIRCLCGKLVEVPSTRPHEAQMIHCSNCGGRLRDQAKDCEYCGCEIGLKDRNVGVACPECFARLVKNARYCRGCGVEIRPERIQAKRLDAACPRCQGGLVHCTVEQSTYTECSTCGGLWLEEEFFQRVVETKDKEAVSQMVTGGVASGAASGKAPAAPASNDVRYLPCPVCANLMHRKNFAGCSGVVIDWCKGHGYWFDTHELEKVVDFVTAGGMDRARARKIANAKRRVARAEKNRPASQFMHTRGGHFPAEPHVHWTPLDEVFAFLGQTLRGLFDR